MVEVLSSHGHDFRSLLRVEGSLFFTSLLLSLTLSSSVETEFGCDILFDLHFAEVVVVLVLEVIFGEHFYCVLVLLWLHRNDVVVLLLLLVDLSIRNIAIKGLQRIASHIRQLRGS